MNNYENSKLKIIAEKILASIPNAPETFGSVIAILMIISVILTLIRIIQECRKSKLKSFLNKDDRYSFMAGEIKDLSLNRTWFTRRTIKKLLKKELPKESYHQYGTLLMNALLDYGSNLSQEETLALMEATNV